MSFLELFDFGSHTVYILSSYAIGIIIFVSLFVAVKMQHKNLIKQLRRRYKLKDQQQKI